MKVLCIGDVVGSPGRKILTSNIPRLRRELSLDAVIVNAENCAAGSGITVPLAQEIFNCGVDAITLGDHAWAQKDFAGTIGQLKNIVRPANYGYNLPGKGWDLITTPYFQFAVVNLLGRVFMQPADCPFRKADEILNEIPRNVPVFVDFHAEATSEKITLAHYLDGRVTAVVGTHTHVQTSDAFVFPGGTAFISDLGMTGPWFSSIGRDFAPVSKKFITGMPGRFDVANGPSTLEGAIITFDRESRKATQIEAFRYREPL